MGGCGPALSDGVAQGSACEGEPDRCRRRAERDVCAGADPRRASLALVLAALAAGLFLVVGCSRGLPKAPSGKAGKGSSRFFNAQCPIDGAAIDSANVAEDLVRRYKAKKLAFCQAACAASWDQLSEADKDAKLAEVKKRRPAGSAPTRPVR